MPENRFPHSAKEDRFEFGPEERAELDRIIEKYPVKRSALIPALHLAQKQAGYITSAAMQHVAGIFEISPMEVWGVVSFYSMLKTHPIGEYHFQVCNNLSCALMGSSMLLRAIEARLGIKAGETREDGKFSLEKVECLGACGGAPCLQINEDYFERMAPGIIEEIVSALERGEYVPPAGADEAAPLREGAAVPAGAGDNENPAGPRGAGD
ncbi:MAG: NAD(P)H-dependent oxidoreductase subunit E [bacterium]